MSVGLVYIHRKGQKVPSFTTDSSKLPSVYTAVQNQTT